MKLRIFFKVMSIALVMIFFIGTIAIPVEAVSIKRFPLPGKPIEIIPNPEPWPPGLIPRPKPVLPPVVEI